MMFVSRIFFAFSYLASLLKQLKLIIMKTILLNISITLLLLLSANTYSQGVTKAYFLELGDKPLTSNQFIMGNSGGSSFSTNSDSNKERVKQIIDAQKDFGFKKPDSANFLLSNTNSIQALYPIEAGYTYRIFAVFRLPKGTSILRAKDYDGNELATEVQSEGAGNLFNYEQSQLQLKDIICTENKNIFIENGLVSDQTIAYATTYLIFKKKS